MSTAYSWISLGPDGRGPEFCQNMSYWEIPIRDVIEHCRKHIDTFIIIDEYGYRYTGGTFLQRMGISEGDGKGVPTCVVDGCFEMAAHKWLRGIPRAYDQRCLEHLAPDPDPST